MGVDSYGFMTEGVGTFSSKNPTVYNIPFGIEMHNCINNALVINGITNAHEIMAKENNWDVLIMPYTDMVGQLKWGIDLCNSLVHMQRKMIGTRYNPMGIYDLIHNISSEKSKPNNKLLLSKETKYRDDRDGSLQFSINKTSSKSMYNRSSTYDLIFRNFSKNDKFFTYDYAVSITSSFVDVDVYKLLSIFDMYAGINTKTKRSVTISLDDNVYFTFARKGLHDGVLTAFNNDTYLFIAILGEERINELKSIYHIPRKYDTKHIFDDATVIV